MALTVGSLFSGIGGLELGLERAGMTVKWQVEIDDYATRVLTKHWPNVPKFRDVRAVGSHNLEPVDLICGGFPCQPHSLAGSKEASSDERDLWGEFARLVREIKPRWVVAENVPGLLSSEDGRFFGRVLRDLAQSGYDAEWSMLSACAVGAPHPRERVFVVAHRARINGQPYSPVLRGQVPSGIRAWWQSEPGVVRVANGVPRRMDRLRGLGNAVVPQVAEYIGRLIMGAA